MAPPLMLALGLQWMAYKAAAGYTVPIVLATFLMCVSWIAWSPSVAIQLVLDIYILLRGVAGFCLHTRRTDLGFALQAGAGVTVVILFALWSMEAPEGAAGIAFASLGFLLVDLALQTAHVQQRQRRAD
jgi:hypothetical protein